jgi:hypothetical protein
LDLLNGIFKDNPEKGIRLQIKDIEKPFDYALAKGIKNVIVPGDIGQTEELSSLAKFYLLELLLKYDGVLNIFIIPGNHDYDRVGVHSMKLFELLCVRSKFSTIHLYTNPTKKIIDGEKFHFVPFPHNKLLPGCVNVAHVEPSDFVREVNGVSYYNDSFSSAAGAAIAAIRAFSAPEILILGGIDKGADFQELAETIRDSSNIKKIIIIGEIQEKLANILHEHGVMQSIQTTNVQTMSEIVALARDSAAPGDIVILSPACASFDMFRDFYDRGDQFREVVQRL